MKRKSIVCLCLMGLVSSASGADSRCMGAKASSGCEQHAPQIIGPHNPDTLTNGEPITVSQHGAHFSGVTVKASGACKLESFKIVSDTEIQMTLRGARRVEGKEDTCYYDFSNAYGSDHTWILVSLTPSEEQEKLQNEREAGTAQANEIYRKVGKRWDIQSSGNIAGSYAASGTDSDGLPLIRRSDGKTLLVVLRPDDSVVLLPQPYKACMYSGTLKDGKVADGQDYQCGSETNSWTATIQP